MDEPIVSVIIPVYNRESFLGRAIGSVLGQSYGDFELIVVDDGSTDNTPEVALSFKDSRMIYVRCNENRGVSVARNRGIAISRGKYLAFLDSDDEWLPGKLEKQVRVMNESPPEVGVIYTGYLQLMDKEVTESPFLSVVRITEGNIHEELLRGDFVLISSALVRREVVKRVGGFDELLLSAEVWDFWLRVSKEYVFRFLRDPLVKRYIHSSNISSSFTDSARIEIEGVRKYLCQKYSQELGMLRDDMEQLGEYGGINVLFNSIRNEGRCVVVFGASARGRGVLRYLKSKGIRCKFFVDNDKKKWGKVVDGLEVKPPDSISKDDVVFVASAWCREILSQLEEMGVKKRFVV